MSSSPLPQPLPGSAPDPAVPAAGPAAPVTVPTAEAGAAEAPAHDGGPSVTASAPVPLWNIANILTVTRLLLVPLFIALLVEDGGHSTAWRLAAAAVFTAASITDRYDGELARKRGLITDFGKIADPIADKALMGAALVTLSVQHRLWWWVTAVILVRELGITLMRFWVIKYGVIAASRGGKLKTLLQALAIFLYLLPLNPAHPDLLLKGLDWLSIAIMAAALAVTVVTGFDYIAQAVRLRRGARPDGAPSTGQAR